jgi:hypothetical protein
MPASASYRVRLEDGVEMGPLDLQMLRSWYQQGMVDRDTPVRPAGQKRWVRLRDAVDVNGWKVTGWSRGAGVADDEEDTEGSQETPQQWRTVVASVVAFLTAAAGGYFLFFPDRWLPALAAAPWREITLVQVLLGLLLVRGWEATRKAARILIFVLTFSLFPVAGLLLVQGASSQAFAVLGSAWVMGSGLFFFLAGRAMSWKSAALSLLWVLAGAGGVGYFGLVR